METDGRNMEVLPPPPRVNFREGVEEKEAEDDDGEVSTTCGVAEGPPARLVGAGDMPSRSRVTMRRWWRGGFVPSTPPCAVELPVVVALEG